MGRGSDDDRDAIMRVIEEETAAYFDKDFERWASCWVQAPYVRRWMWFGQGGITVREGWDQQGPAMKQAMAVNPMPNSSAFSLRRENVNIRVGGEMAWVTFDQHAPTTGDAFDVPGLQNELRILEKHGGKWKIACVCVLQRSLDYVSFPLLRVDEHASVTWMNPAAAAQLRDEGSLVVRAGRLRAVERGADQRLQAAIRWAARLDEGPAAQHTIPNAARQGTLPIVIGGGHGEPANVCWVIAESDMILVSVNDLRMMEERLRAAVVVYGITPAQQRLAALIIAGHGLVAAADLLGVGVSTARTHLQRMFDKTGVRSQPALVRALLSVGSPRI